MKDNNKTRMVSVSPDFIAEVGFPSGFLVQQIHYWCRFFANDPKRYAEEHFKQGRWWVRNTYEQWHEQLPCFSGKTIQRSLEELENKGVILTGNFNKLSIDRTKWYAIDYDVLHHAYPCVKDIYPDLRIGQIVQIDSGQNEKKEKDKLSKAIPNNSYTKNSYTKNNYMEFSEENTARLDFGIVSRQIEKACKELEINDKPAIERITATFEYFFEAYRVNRGAEHPRMKDKTVTTVIESLRYSSVDDCYAEFRISEVGLSTVKQMIDKYFFTRFRGNCSYSISHFATEKILVYRYLEVGGEDAEDGLPFE